MSERALVTGGAGFIGSNLVRALLERGDEVRVLDNFSTGYRENLERLDVETIEGELRSYERVHAAVRGVEVVFHLGALGSVPRSVQDPLTSSAVNVEGTLNVLLAARDENVRRVVFSSSSSVYGNTPTLPKVETAGKNEFKGTVTIGIDKNGMVSFNGQNVSDQELLVLLERVKNVDRDIQPDAPAANDRPRSVFWVFFWLAAACFVAKVYYLNDLWPFFQNL